MDVAVVSTRVNELQAALSARAPSDMVFHYATGLDDLSEAARLAPIALGAPDVLAPVLAHMDKLRWVQSTWAGITPFLEAPRRDYLLTGVKDIFGTSMAEYVLGWLLALERNILGHARAKRWHWEPERGTSELRLGIAGVGSIGAHVARACRPFFADVVGLNSDGRPIDDCTRCFSMADRLDFATGLDALVMILPDTRSTDRLVDAQMLAQLAPGAVLLNVGRANSLDHDAACAALATGQLRAAVLDVLPVEPLPEDDPLWQVENLYITSHTSAPTQMDAIVGVFLRNLERFQQGQPLNGVIEFDRGY